MVRQNWESPTLVGDFAQFMPMFRPCVGQIFGKNCALHCVSACVYTSDYFYSSDSEDSRICVEYNLFNLYVFCLLSAPQRAECVFVQTGQCRKTSSNSAYIYIYMCVLPSIPVRFALRAVTSHSIYSRFTLYSQQSWFYGGLHPPARGRHQLDLSGIRLPLQSPFHEHPVYKHYWFSHCAFCTCI